MKKSKIDQYRFDRSVQMQEINAELARRGINLSISFEDYMRKSLEEDPTMPQHSLWHAYCAEEYWLRSEERNVIFIQDKDVLSSLLALSFKMDHLRALPDGMKSGIVVPPKYSEYREHRIRPFCFSLTTWDERNTFMTESARRLIPYYPEIIAQPDPQSMCLTLVCSNGKQHHTTLCMSEAEITKLMSLSLDKLIHDDAIVDLVPELKGSESDRRKDELISQLLTARLIMATIAYNQATHDQYLQSGVPEGYKADKKQKAFNHRSAYVMKIGDKLKRQTKQQGVHVRGAHLKQLVHPRFYQGKYANLERGSRIIEVDSYVAGARTAHTQTTEHHKDSD